MRRCFPLRFTDVKTFELTSFEFGSSQPEGERKCLAIRSQSTHLHMQHQNSSQFAFTVTASAFTCLCFAVHVHSDPSGGADSCHHPQQARLDVGGRNGSQRPGSLYRKWGHLDPRARRPWRGSAGNGPGPVSTADSKDNNYGPLTIKKI